VQSDSHASGVNEVAADLAGVTVGCVELVLTERVRHAWVGVAQHVIERDSAGRDGAEHVLTRVSVTAIVHVMCERRREPATTVVDDARDFGVEINPREGRDVGGGRVRCEHDRREKRCGFVNRVRLKPQPLRACLPTGCHGVPIWRAGGAAEGRTRGEHTVATQFIGVGADNVGVIFVVAKGAADVVLTEIDLVGWVGRAQVGDPE
jgi:hypothetical protein